MEIRWVRFPTLSAVHRAYAQVLASELRYAVLFELQGLHEAPVNSKPLR
jgi:hypothetical protein